MITLQNLGDSILFTFDENDKYLNNGTISVPMNSLILVTDDSDMATFRKSATNDIFVSALYSDFGMTKAELEQWYAENMVSEVTEEDVDEKIAEAVGEETDRAVSAETALSGAIDAVDAAYKAADSVISGAVDNLSSALQNESQRAISAETALSGAIDAVDAAYKAADSVISGAVDNLSTALQNESQRAISAETALSGAIDSIDARLTEDEGVIGAGLNDLNERKLDASAYTPTDLSNYYTKSETSGATEISTALNAKQDTLIAGDNITISGNVISAEGGGVTVDPSLDSGSTNPVANSAITEAVIIDASNRDSITSNDYGGFRTFYATQVKSISFTKSYAKGYIEGYILLDDSATKYVFSGNTSSSTTLTDAVTLNLASKIASITVKDRNAHTIRELYMQIWDDNTKQDSGYIYNVATVFNPPLGVNKAEFVNKCQHYGINVTNNSIGGGSSYTAGDGIDITNDVISVTGKVDTSAITTSITSSSTDSQVPSAKAVYDALQESGLDEDTEKLISGSLNDLNERKLDASAYTPTDLTNYYTKSETSGATEISTALNAKQDTLIAGDNITISGNVISAEGGGVTVDPSLDSGSTNPVANSAITTAFNETNYGVLYAIETSSANTEALGGLKLVKISQAAYDALENKDANTLYIIVDEPTPPTSLKYTFTLTDDSVVSGECDSTNMLLGAETSAYTSTLKEAVVGDCVTILGNSAFNGCSALTSVTIPSGVTEIYALAFGSCSSLANIDIPSGVTTIGVNAFQNCSSLPSVTIPSGVTNIGQNTFNNCSSLTNIDIPSGVTTIGNGAFNGCSGLTSITVEATTPPTLGEYAFLDTNDCPIYVPCESVEAYKTAWSDYADRITCVQPSFDGKYKFTLTDDSVVSGECDSSSALTTTETSTYTDTLKEAVIGDCVTSIGADAFDDCSSLTSINIPSSVTTIGNSAFRNCSSLTSIDIPNSVTTIGANAFRNCFSLTSIDIPNSVTSIGEYAFGFCSSLTSINIPNSVTSIGEYAFHSCSGLTSITVNATTPPTLGEYAFDITNDCPIYVPCESVEAYKTAWSDYADRITCVQPSFDGKYKFTLTDDSVVSGECDASSAITSGETSAYKTTLKEAVIGDCVTDIGRSAFTECINLTSCTIGSGVTSIKNNAFSKCNSLSSIRIPDSVTDISEQAFSWNSGLTSVTIGSGVTSIGAYAFAGCSGLTSIDIPNSVITIVSDAFYQCSGLASLNIPSSVTSIGGSAFYGCSGLTSITVNATTPPTLDSSAFNYTNDCPIYVPSASVETYKAATNWSTYASRIQAIS